MNIVLIGATGGIGRCLTKDLLNNHELYLGGHNKSNLSSLASEFNLSSNQVSEVDVKSFDSINNFMLSADKYLSSIDCIINCVGSLLLKPAHLTTEQDLEDVFRTNVFSCFGLLKHSFKFLKDSGGQLIFFSSAASKVGLKNHEAISSAKAAVSAMVLSAASTYARYNIRVNAIAPGLVDTPLTNKIISNKVSLDYSKSLHGLNRIGKPENFIPIINSLIDERSDWITGQTFFIDGGLSNVK
tara:strand:+ start:48 stop:773 length:726 start_codon:yes stop_codon:yes gene_type:complete